MGLDSVELVMAFEETFQISISDQEAERMRTPRDVIDCIAAKLDAKAGDPVVVIRAKEESAWVHLTHALQGLGVMDGEVGRDQKLDDVFADRSSRQQRWRQLKEQLDVKAWPRLRWFGLSTDFPSNLKTLGDLSEWMSHHHLLRLTEDERQALTRGDIAFLVKHIILDQLGLQEEQYGEDKRFIEDLGLD